MSLLAPILHGIVQPIVLLVVNNIQYVLVCKLEVGEAESGLWCKSRLNCCDNAQVPCGR
jgi:hypothetical protein